MCTFIKLTCVTLNTVSYINMDSVDEIRTGDKGTRLYFGESEYVTVVETPEQIIHKLEEMNN